MIQMVISYGGGNNYMAKILEELFSVENSGRYRSSSFKVQHYGTHVSILNHSYEAGFVWDEPTIIRYKPQIRFDTLQTVWQIFTSSPTGVTLQTFSAYYSTNHVYLHRPNAFGFWQTRLHLCYETLKRVSNFSELA